MPRNTFLEQVARGLTKLSTASRLTATTIMMELLIFILDRSASMEESCGRVTRLEAAKQATIAMLDSREQLGADDHVAIIAFNHEAQIVLPFTYSVEKVPDSRSLKAHG